MKNSIKVLSIQLEIVYRLMLKRMAQGITAEQLSALLGREPDYISKVEMLQTSLDHDTELLCVATALGDPNTNFFLHGHTDAEVVSVIMEKEVFGGTHFHSCDICVPDSNATLPYFFLLEPAAVKDQPLYQTSAN